MEEQIAKTINLNHNVDLMVYFQMELVPTLVVMSIFKKTIKILQKIKIK